MTDITFEQGDKDALAFIDTKEIIKHMENLGYQVVDKSEPSTDPLINQIIEALTDSIENSSELLQAHKDSFGEDTRKNKATGDVYRSDIRRAENLINQLKRV